MFKSPKFNNNLIKIVQFVTLKLKKKLTKNHFVLSIAWAIYLQKQIYCSFI